MYHMTKTTHQYPSKSYLTTSENVLFTFQGHITFKQIVEGRRENVCEEMLFGEGKKI